jgi:hypothetical protein
VSRQPPPVPVHRMKTSEVMRRCADLLRMVADNSRDSDILASADELALRARWIEVARTDAGVTEERRLAIAAVEDAEGRDIASS